MKLKLSNAEIQEVLRSWPDLNDLLRELDDPQDVYKLLKAEQAGRNRPVIASRIYSRFNRLRALHERRTLFQPR